jgi:glycosyltransferase involved in cell wall biosynthesis
MTKQNQPLVSVIMPVHNAGRFLAPAIESILAQTYKNFELIIVDDASTDDSWKTISQYAKKYKKQIQGIQTKKQVNSAGNGATNYGLKFAKGEFIARMDADDISLPKRLEKQVAYMTQNPDTILLGTQAYVVDQKGKITGKKSLPVTHEGIYKEYGIIHPIVHPTVMIRRSLLPNPKKIYEMKWDVNDDYYTFFKLLGYGTFANLPEYLLKYRVHGGNLSLSKPKTKFYNSVSIRLQAVTKLGYNMSYKAWGLMLSQLVLVTLLPERAIVPFYMLLRGMSEQKKNLLVAPAPLFFKKYYTVQ